MAVAEKKNITIKVRDYLSQQQDVVFAYLFGSFASRERYRDIDVGIYMDPYPDLIRLGNIKVALDKLLKVKAEVDLVLLNGIPKENPTFGFQVIRSGNLLVNKDITFHKDYKNRILCHYFDTAYIRDKMDQAFSDRVKGGKFALRNYE